MIVFVGDGDTIQTYLDSWGAPLAGRLRVLSYEHLFRARRLPMATYIFGEVDLLDARAAARSARLWTYLERTTPSVRLLNHPLRAHRRYELLRTLKERGLNAFDVYRATEARQPARFPVFVRLGREHGPPMTPLLNDQKALQAALREFVDAGYEREDTLIMEFCDTADQRGLYRKYSAFVVGDRIVAGHVAFSMNWIARGTRAYEDEFFREELDYVRTNPHETALREVAALSEISYGRIDYGVLNGRVQIWEVNTNPYLMAAEFGPAGRRPACEHSAQALYGAFMALDSPMASSRSFHNPLRREWVRMKQRRIVQRALRLLRMSRHEHAVIEALSKSVKGVSRLSRQTVTR